MSHSKASKANAQLRKSANRGREAWRLAALANSGACGEVKVASRLGCTEGPELPTAVPEDSSKGAAWETCEAGEATEAAAAVLTGWAEP